MEYPGSSKLTSNHKSDLESHFTALNSTFISQGIPVVIGEMGATNKDNFTARKEWFTYYLGLCKTYNVAQFSGTMVMKKIQETAQNLSAL